MVQCGWGGRSGVRRVPQVSCRTGDAWGRSAVMVWHGKELRSRIQAHGKSQETAVDSPAL